MSEIDYYEFPTCMHALAAAFHRCNIQPCRIVLPFDDWWRLWNVLEQKHRGMLVFDGRGNRPDQFMYMGFTFVIDTT